MFYLNKRILDDKTRTRQPTDRPQKPHKANTGSLSKLWQTFKKGVDLICMFGVKHRAICENIQQPAWQRGLDIWQHLDLACWLWNPTSKHNFLQRKRNKSTNKDPQLSFTHLKADFLWVTAETGFQTEATDIFYWLEDEFLKKEWQVFHRFCIHAYWSHCKTISTLSGSAQTAD